MKKLTVWTVFYQKELEQNSKNSYHYPAQKYCCQFNHREKGALPNKIYKTESLP